MFEIGKTYVNGNLEEVLKTLKSLPPATTNEHMMNILTDISFTISLFCDFPTLHILAYSGMCSMMRYGMKKILLDEIDPEALGPADLAMRNLCSVARSISEDPDIAPECKKTIIDRLVPMNCVLTKAEITLNGNDIKKLFSTPEELFSTQRNDVGAIILPDKYDEDYVAHIVISKLLMVSAKNEISHIFAGDCQSYDVAEWYRKKFFRYHNNKNMEPKFTLASLKENDGRLDFLGVPAETLRAQMTRLESANNEIKVRRESPIATVVATTTIRDMMEFMGCGQNSVRILAVKPMQEWVNNQIFIDPSEMVKYMIRISEPVTEMKKYISRLLTSKDPSKIPDAITACFGGHMIDYVMEIRPDKMFDYDMNTYVDSLLPVTHKKYCELEKTIMKLHNQISTTTEENTPT